MLRHAARIAWKDLRVELRSKEIVATMVFFGTLLVVIYSFAFPHDDRPFAERELVVNGARVAYARLGVYPSLATHAGQPATVFPVRISQTGLPIALQVIGPYLEDRTPIRFAQLLAPEIGGYVSPAGYE